jgi:hypothetical protein
VVTRHRVEDGSLERRSVGAGQERGSSPRLTSASSSCAIVPMRQPCGSAAA